MIDNRTTHLNLQLPDPANSLDVDVLRIIAALNAIDTAVTTKVTIDQVMTAISAVVGAAPSALSTLAAISAQLATDESAAAALVAAVSAKQAALVSAINIKTINGQSLLGSGDIALTVNGVTIMGGTYQSALLI